METGAATNTSYVRKNCKKQTYGKKTLKYIVGIILFSYYHLKKPWVQRVLCVSYFKAQIPCKETSCKS